MVRQAPPPRPVAGHLVPTLLLAGVSHAGASELGAGLGRHPQICLPQTRRVDQFTALRYGQAACAPQSALEDYDRHFAGWAGERHRLETSPVYFDGGPRLVAEVAAAMPDVRVVLVLRDPAERLWASYVDKVGRGRLCEAMTFDRFVDRCLALRANGADRFEGNRYFRTFSSGSYVDHLPTWVETFGNRLRILFAEQVEDRPAEQRDALLRWLGLDPTGIAPAQPPEPALVRATPGAGARARLWPFGRQVSDERRCVPRQGEHQRKRVRALYAEANRELAGYLRRRGHVHLPEWLLDA